VSPFNPVPETTDEGHYFTIEELRATDTSYADTEKYPADRLEEVRAEVEADFEAEGHCAFVTRTATEIRSGEGGTQLFVGNPFLQGVSAVTIDGAALTSEQLAEIVCDDTVLYRAAGWPVGIRNITVTYTHGYAETPAPIKRRALKVAADRLVPGELPANATAQVVDGVNYRIALTSERNPFGDPDIIATIRRFGRSGTYIG
jgi:hypothetical protein